MSNYFLWLMHCFTLILMGAVLGWSIRAASVDDQYIRTLTERNQTEIAYYTQQYDRQAQINQKLYGRNEHGKKLKN